MKYLTFIIILFTFSCAPSVETEPSPNTILSEEVSAIEYNAVISDTITYKVMKKASSNLVYLIDSNTLEIKKVYNTGEGFVVGLLSGIVAVLILVLIFILME